MSVAARTGLAWVILSAYITPAFGLEAAPDAGQSGVDGPSFKQGSEDLAVDSLLNLSLEELLEITVTATGTQMSLQEAPSIIAVINHRDIKRRGYRTVADALRHVAGIHMVDDHLYQHVGVRGVFSATGTPNDIVQVMINGQQTAFRPTNGNFLGCELIPIEAIDRIEVLRGPASALYGANALLGVINIITFQGHDSELMRRPGSAVTLDGYLMQNPATSTGNGSVSFLSANQRARFRYMISGGFHYADRSGLVVPGIEDVIQANLHRSDPAAHSAPRGYPTPGLDASARQFILENSASKNDRERTGSAYGIASYAFSDAVTLWLDGHFQYFDRNAEWQDFSFLTHDTRITHTNGFGRLRLQLGKFEPKSFGLEASLAASHMEPLGQERVSDRLVANAFRRRRLSSTSLDVVVQGAYTFDARSSIRLGIDFAHDAQDLLKIESVSEDTGTVTDDGGFGRRDFDNVGVFTQLTWNPWDRLQLTAGARLDHNSVIACSTLVWNCLGSLPDETVLDPEGEETLVDRRGIMQLSSRAAAVYEFSVAGLYAKLIYGSSYKPPSPFQLFRRRLTITGSSIGNPSLQPQTGNTVEAQIGLRPLKGLHASLVGFSTWVNDTVLFLNESGRLVGRNADMEVQGLETSVTYSGGALSWFMNGSFLLHSAVTPERRRDETDFLWSNSPFNTTIPVGGYPDVVLSGGVDLSLPEAFLNANVTLRVVGPRRASLVNTQLMNRNLDTTYELPAYVDTDLTLSSVGLRPLGNRETIVSLSVRGIPGGFVEAGSGGIDVPSLGPRVHLRVTQEF